MSKNDIFFFGLIVVTSEAQRLFPTQMAFIFVTSRLSVPELSAAGIHKNLCQCLEGLVPEFPIDWVNVGFKSSWRGLENWLSG